MELNDNNGIAAIAAKEGDYQEKGKYKDSSHAQTKPSGCSNRSSNKAAGEK
jgi:hypothetical protein